MSADNFSWSADNVLQKCLSLSEVVQLHKTSRFRDTFSVHTQDIHGFSAVFVPSEFSESLVWVSLVWTPTSFQMTNSQPAKLGKASLPTFCLGSGSSWLDWHAVMIQHIFSTNLSVGMPLLEFWKSTEKSTSVSFWGLTSYVDNKSHSAWGLLAALCELITQAWMSMMSSASCMIHGLEDGSGLERSQAGGVPVSERICFGRAHCTNHRQLVKFFQAIKKLWSLQFWRDCLLMLMFHEDKSQFLLALLQAWIVIWWKENVLNYSKKNTIEHGSKHYRWSQPGIIPQSDSYSFCDLNWVFWCMPVQSLC